jgi:hypothetical protein
MRSLRDQIGFVKPKIVSIEAPLGVIDRHHSARSVEVLMSLAGAAMGCRHLQNQRHPAEGGSLRGTRLLYWHPPSEFGRNRKAHRSTLSPIRMGNRKPRPG